jgi:hypothetical protein
MEDKSALDYLMTYGWMVLVVAIVGAAIFASLQDGGQVSPGELNKSQAKQIVERGAGQSCEWKTFEGDSGRLDCTQEFTWNNQSYLVHDYFDVELVNGTVEITQ